MFSFQPLPYETCRDLCCSVADCAGFAIGTEQSSIIGCTLYTTNNPIDYDTNFQNCATIANEVRLYSARA